MHQGAPQTPPAKARVAFPSFQPPQPHQSLSPGPHLLHQVPRGAEVGDNLIHGGADSDQQGCRTTERKESTRQPTPRPQQHLLCSTMGLTSPGCGKQQLSTPRPGGAGEGPAGGTGGSRSLCRAGGCQGAAAGTLSSSGLRRAAASEKRARGGGGGASPAPVPGVAQESRGPSPAAPLPAPGAPLPFFCSARAPRLLPELPPQGCAAPVAPAAGGEGLAGERGGRGEARGTAGSWPQPRPRSAPPRPHSPRRGPGPGPAGPRSLMEPEAAAGRRAAVERGGPGPAALGARPGPYPAGSGGARNEREREKGGGAREGPRPGETRGERPGGGSRPPAQ